MANTYRKSILKSADKHMLSMGVGLFCFGGAV